MSLLTGTELSGLINSGKKTQIFVKPMLTHDQLGAVSLDLRLGYGFLVSVQSRKPSIVIGQVLLLDQRVNHQNLNNFSSLPVGI